MFLAAPIVRRRPAPRAAATIVGMPDRVSLPQFSHYPAMAPPVEVRLSSLAEHECSYLPGRLATSRAFLTDRMPGELYHRFMDAGFRRSGRVFYQPTCGGCRACIPVRVPLAKFRPDKSQRRCARRNSDLRITAGEPKATEEKFALYSRYLAEWHGREADDFESFRSFLYDSPVDSVEFEYRDAEGALLAVGICDVCEQSLSSVYFFFDPAHSERGLGTFGALYEIATATRLGIPHYYLGYWIRDCRQMRYKTSFRPCELLGTDGTWRPAEDRGSADVALPGDGSPESSGDAMSDIRC
jgi:arginyl-tRNA--protein-N-Asp/Glu arginylyltransferase